MLSSDSDEEDSQESPQEHTESGLPLGKRKSPPVEDEETIEHDNGRVSMMRQPGVPEFGTVLFTDEYGEWRSVPGFDKDKVRVSSRGWVQVYSKDDWHGVTRGSLRLDGRHTVQTNFHSYLVYQLVCRAFHGPQLEESYSVDHINRDTSDNCYENLRWSNTKDQAINKNKRRLSSTSKPIYVQKLDSSDEPQWFESVYSASKKLGVNNGNLSKSADLFKENGKIKKVSGYHAWWAPASEPQHDLEPGNDCNLMIEPVSSSTSQLLETGPSTYKEEWIDVTETFRISNRGRIQKKQYNIWGYKYTPIPTKGNVYPAVTFSGRQLLFRGGIDRYNGKPALLHRIVWMAFGENEGYIPHGMTIDHKSSDRKFDARICNLRVATEVQQKLNRIHKHLSNRNASRKKSIMGKPRHKSHTTWVTFESINDAARYLNDTKSSTSKFSSGNISAVLKGRYTHHNGWVFKHE